SRLRFDDDRLVAQHYGRAQGLASDTVLFVGRDRLNRMWVGSSSGADVWTGERFVHVGQGEGMRSEDTCQNAFFADGDGAVWIGTPRGALRGALANRESASTVRVVPIAVNLGGREMTLGESAEVPWGQRSLTASFAAPAFRSEGRIRYRFHLA